MQAQQRNTDATKGATIAKAKTVAEAKEAEAKAHKAERAEGDC